MLTDARPAYRPKVSEVGDYCMSDSMFGGAATLKIGLLRVWAILTENMVFISYGICCVTEIYFVI